MISHRVSYDITKQDLKQGEGLSTPIFFGLFLLYQLLLTFQGLDLLDEGAGSAAPGDAAHKASGEHA